MKVEKSNEFAKRIPQFIDVIIEVAQGNFGKQINLSGQNDDLDALAMGINMMIDDLKNNIDLQLKNKQIQEMNDRLLKANKKAKHVKVELEEYKSHLEELIHYRTLELQEKNNELEHFNDLFVSREFRIKELKDRIAELEEQLKQKNR